MGTQLGGALKNVIALAAGISDGMKLGYNARAALIVRGLAESSRLAVAMGGRADTLAGLAGMGDLVLTCTGDLSRNRTVGYRLGQGESLTSILGDMTAVAEGVKTAEAVRDLASEYGVEMPIAEEVYVRNTVDRVDTFGTVFLGMTVGCARCHDHKYDPITQKDYYSLFAFFNNLDGPPLDGNKKTPPPVMKVPTAEQGRQMAKLDREIQALMARIEGPSPELDAAQAEWERREYSKT